MKGREGITLILSIIFMLALSILLVAVLLLSNQEIYATQVCLNGNKAFYYAEAGVEYAQAQLLNGKSVDELNQPSVDNSLKEKLDSRISSLNLQVENPSSSEYTLTCKVNYNKTNRKIVKKIKLYTGIWEYAMSSANGIDLKINTGQGGKVVIDGDISSKKSITGDITLLGGDTPPASSGVYILNNHTYTSSMSLIFPPTTYDYYESIASYKYNNQDEFVNALKLDPSNPNYPGSGIVYINGDLDIKKDFPPIPTGITIVVNGDVHVVTGENETLSMDGGEKMVAFISKSLKFNNDGVVNFTNCILYTTSDADFTNMKADVSIKNGAIYAQEGYISLNNIRDTFLVERGTWTYRDLLYATGNYSLFPIYTIESWSDLGA